SAGRIHATDPSHYTAYQNQRGSWAEAIGLATFPQRMKPSWDDTRDAGLDCAQDPVNTACQISSESRRYDRIRSLVRYSQHRTLPRPSGARVVVALLRAICKQWTQPARLPRPGIDRLGDTRRTCDRQRVGISIATSIRRTCSRDA